MKKNYTLKIVLAMLIVVLVSLVSFVGVYKGKNLLKDYALGKDFSQRKVVSYSVTEDTQTSEEQNSENTEETKTDENSEENTETTTETNQEQNNENQANQNQDNADNKKKQYNESKNIIERRLAAMGAEEYDVRLDEETGKIMIEVPSTMNSSYFSDIVSTGKIQVLNQSSNEVVIESNGFKKATTRIDTANYSTPYVLLNIKFTNDAKNKLKTANTNYTNSEGNESEATFAITLDGTTLYSDTATSFVESTKDGELELVLGQNADAKESEEYYDRSLALVSIINNGEVPVKYEQELIEVVSSNINIKTIIIISIIIGALMMLFALYKFKVKAILPVLSLVGLVATILLTLRYTNVKITLFSILGIAIITIANYILIMKTLGNEKTFKQNFAEISNMLVPTMILAIVFCCAPYLQLASLGMSIFWGLIVMIIYDAIITRILINK